MSVALKPAAAASPRMVRLAPVFGHCHLFQPLAKSSSRPAYDEPLKYADARLRIQAPQVLGAPEQTLLLVLLELASEQHRRNPRQCKLAADNLGELACQLRVALYEDCLPEPAKPTLMLSTSWSEVQRRCGRTHLGGTALGVRRAELKRLAAVVVSECGDSATPGQACHLIGFRVGERHLQVALHPLLAVALLEGPYAQVLLSERLALRTPVAMLTHTFLSSCLAPGQKRPLRIGYETLAKRLWHGTRPGAAASTRKRRLRDAKAALQAVGGLAGWRVTLKASGAVVARLSRVTSPAPATARASERRRAARRPAAATGARDMTRPRHFAAPDTSYAERPLYVKASTGAPSPRYDERGKNY